LNILTNVWLKIGQSHQKCEETLTMQDYSLHGTCQSMRAVTLHYSKEDDRQRSRDDVFHVITSDGTVSLKLDDSKCMGATSLR
jgi:hypothetical protein